MGGKPRQGRQQKSVPSKEEQRRTGASVSEPGPQHRAGPGRRHRTPESGLGGWGPGHPPLLADEQQQKRDQAGDECQADPDDGPRVIAGPCRGTAGTTL